MLILAYFALGITTLVVVLVIVVLALSQRTANQKTTASIQALKADTKQQAEQAKAHQQAQKQIRLAYEQRVDRLLVGAPTVITPSKSS